MFQLSPGHNACPIAREQKRYWNGEGDAFSMRKRTSNESCQCVWPSAWRGHIAGLRTGYRLEAIG